MNKMLFGLSSVVYKPFVSGLMATMLCLGVPWSAQAGAIRGLANLVFDAAGAAIVYGGTKYALDRGLAQLVANAARAVDMADAHDPAYPAHLAKVKDRLSFHIFQGPRYVSYALLNVVEQDPRKSG